VRIGLLADVYKPFMSGVTYFVSQHKQALEALGHEVFVFTLGHVDYEDEESHVYRSPAIPVTETGYHFGFAYSRPARRQLRTMDLLHVQHPFISGMLAVTYGRRYGIPVIFTHHSRYDRVVPHYVPLVPGSVPEALLEAYLPWFANRCQAVTTPTEVIRRLLRRYGVTVRIAVLPNGVNLLPFRTPACRQTRAGLGLSEEARVSVYVGRIAPEKNLPFLLHAFARVCRELPEACLVVVGYGPGERELHDQAKALGIVQNTLFTGRVPYEQVPGYLALADLFVTASTVEVQPLSIIEGLAAGLPAVAIASDAVSDTLVDGYNALLAAYDSQRFADRWVGGLSDEDLRARLSANARDSSRRYEVHRTAAQMAELYREVVEAYRRRPEGG
jgi:1,2-diacylglycerol 3-alpha-glucosyltransferase